MSDLAPLDTLFQAAVAAIDAGDVATLERLLEQRPELLSERLEEPGAWLKDEVGAALAGFFARPYLLWFVAEDPVRTGRLPANIAEVTRALIAAARARGVPSLAEQLEGTLSLVAWSTVARKCGVQIPLIDTLLDAGASPAGHPERALVNGHREAAAHLVARGAPLTWASALALGRWDDLARLTPGTSVSDRQFALVLVALHGDAEGVRRALALSARPELASEDLFPHGTPLHHAVSSGSLEAVRALLEAGARADIRDSLWGATPLGWASHCEGQHAGTERARAYPAIAAALRAAGATE